MPQKPAAEEWIAKANFVFTGAVVKLNATTVKHLAPTDSTAIVKVEHATRAPEILEQYVGIEITVQLSANERVAAGERAIFYTQSLMVGESLVVQSFGHLPVTTRTAAHEADPALREQVANADIVVTGKVTKVRTIESTPARASRGRPRSGTAVSEHDPVWREAVIQVTDIELGDQSPKEIVVRFPASTDVLWHKAPKFEPGQQGVFLLTRGQSGKRAVGKQAPYTALSPASFQPMQKVEAIRSIIRSQKH